MPLLDSNNRRRAFWGYLFTIIIVILLAAILGGINNSNVDRTRLPYALPRTVAILIWFVALAFLAIAVYYGTMCADTTTAVVLNLLFMLQLIFFVVWFFVYQRFGDYNSTFWSGIVLIILGLATLFFLWQVGSNLASILVLLYLVWIGYEVFVAYQTLKKNGQNII